MNELQPVEKSTKRRTSRIMVALAHGNDGQVLLCEDSVALEFVRESGGGVSPCEGAFILSDCGVDIEPPPVPGVYIGELRIVDGGPESWEMPHIHDYYAEVRNLRPVTKEEWKSHLSGEWPEEWNAPDSCPTCDGHEVHRLRRDRKPAAYAAARAIDRRTRLRFWMTYRSTSGGSRRALRKTSSTGSERAVASRASRRELMRTWLPRSMRQMNDALTPTPSARSRKFRPSLVRVVRTRVESFIASSWDGRRGAASGAA